MNSVLGHVFMCHKRVTHVCLVGSSEERTGMKIEILES